MLFMTILVLCFMLLKLCFFQSHLFPFVHFAKQVVLGGNHTGSVLASFVSACLFHVNPLKSQNFTLMGLSLSATSLYIVFQQDNLAFPLICLDWNADEEMLLLEVISSHSWDSLLAFNSYYGASSIIAPKTFCSFLC